jgi:hypothetical protein
MNSKKYLAFMIYFLSLNTYSSVGEEVQSFKGQDAICSIQVFNANNELQWTCSGTLNNKTAITTAAHCVDDFKKKNLTVDVKCGYQGIPDINKAKAQETPKGNRNVVSGTKFKEKAEIMMIMYPVNARLPDNDGATLLLSKPMSIEPIKTIETQNKSDFYYVNDDGITMLKDNVECITSGFGLSESKGKLFGGMLTSSKMKGAFVKGSGTYTASGSIYYQGNLNTSDNDNFDCRVQKYIDSIDGKRAIGDNSFWNDIMYVLKNTARTSMLKQGAVLPGDSGGPLLCRKNENSPWIQLGVSSNVNITNHTKISGNKKHVKSAFYNFFFDLTHSTNSEVAFYKM